MTKLNRHKPSCPFCGRKKDRFIKLSRGLQNASTLLIGLLKFGILILLLILIGAALVK